jgi:serine/threonine-protein phosphatase 6 regulatory ankyrin repeat subunit B
MASHTGHDEVVSLLITAGANINCTCEGVTALMMASQNGHMDIVVALLNSDAKMGIVNVNGFNALCTASQGGHIEIVELLLAREAHRIAKAHSLATRFGHTDIVDILAPLL